MYDGANNVEGDGFTIAPLVCDDEDDGGDMVAVIVDGIVAVSVDDDDDDDDGTLDATANGSVDDTVAYIGGACV